MAERRNVIERLEFYDQGHMAPDWYAAVRCRSSEAEMLMTALCNRSPILFELHTLDEHGSETVSSGDAIVTRVGPVEDHAGGDTVSVVICELCGHGPLKRARQ